MPPAVAPSLDFSGEPPLPTAPSRVPPRPRGKFAAGLAALAAAPPPGSAAAPPAPGFSERADPAPPTRAELAAADAALRAWAQWAAGGGRLPSVGPAVAPGAPPAGGGAPGPDRGLAATIAVERLPGFRRARPALVAVYLDAAPGGFRLRRPGECALAALGRLGWATGPAGDPVVGAADRVLAGRAGVATLVTVVAEEFRAELALDLRARAGAGA